MEKIRAEAEQFVRVRLARIEGADLARFKFDLDLTFMAFFLDHQGRIISRYGGRDSRDADNRQSLEGLAHVMREVLAVHSDQVREAGTTSADGPVFAEKLGAAGRGCIHCHQAQEAINRTLVRNLEWDSQSAWRYPLPENVGIRLHVDKGNLVEKVIPGSPAFKAGLAPGDHILQAGPVPVLSFADMRQALDEAPGAGTLGIRYRRNGKVIETSLGLPIGWRKTDITWRPSLRALVPASPVAGRNLTNEERKSLGLPEKALAFRQKDTVAQAATDAGIRPGDIILGAEGSPEDLDSYGFQEWVRREFLVGDTIRISLVRDGRRLVLPVALGRR